MKYFSLLILIITLSGCAQNTGPETYSVGSVGQVNRTISAIVISVREITISGTSGVGATSGTLAGAVAGSSIGGSSRANAVGAIGGAVIAGIAGAAIEQNMTKQQGLEYIVQTENGNLMTLVQGDTPKFNEGQKVFVLYGSPSRIIADPRAK